MATALRSRGPNTEDKNNKMNEKKAKQTNANAAADAEPSKQQEYSKILAELDKMRKENKEGHKETKLSLTKLDSSIQELKGEITTLKTRTTEVESCISAVEDDRQRRQREPFAI